MPAGCLWDSNKAMGFAARNASVSLWYMLGVLNSKLYNFLAKKVLNTTNCIQIDDIRRLPFRYPSQETKALIETLVKQIVENLRKHPGYDYSREKGQIDELIFELYGTPKRLRNFIETHC
jgi:hypothetical protein